MASVTYYSNSYGGRQLRLVLNQDKTTISWTLYSEGGSSNYYTIFNTRIVIAGQTVYNPGTVSWDSYAFPAAKGSTGGSISIAKGTTSVAVIFQGSVYYNYSTDYGGTFYLDTTYNAPYYSSVAASPSRTSVVLTANINTDGASITGGGWDVSTDGGSTWTYYNGGPTNSTITGLTPNRQYWYRGYVETAGGSANSGWHGFTTTGNAPSASSISASNVTRTSANLSIAATYDTNASYSAAEFAYGTVSGSYPTSTTSSVTGLTPNTTYYIQGRVKDNFNRWSNYVTGSFTTTGNAPTIVSHGISTYGSASVFMKYSATYDMNDSFQSCKWEFGTVSGTYTKVVENTTQSNTQISGLTANTVYYYRLTVTSTRGRSTTATGSIKTDYATQQITSLLADDITVSSLRILVAVPNPTWLNKVTCWVYQSDGTTLITSQVKESGITASNTFLFEDLDAGTEYVIKSQIVTYSQNYPTKINGNNSTIKTLTVSTEDDTPVNIIRSDGTIEKYKMHIMGSGNIYTPSKMSWQNGYYSTGTVGVKINTLLTQSTSVDGGAASTTSYIEILPSTLYTIKNEETDVNFIIHGTDDNNNVTTVGYTLTAGSTYNYTGTSNTTRLWIGIVSIDNPMINHATASLYKMNIFRTIGKTLITKDNIGRISDKIRYIDIIQAGNSVDDNTQIVELKVFDLAGNNVALNKPVTMIKGKDPLNLDKITDGIVDSTQYATISPKTNNDLETIIRVDLGQEYDDIDYIQLWRYYEDGRTYHGTKIYGRDVETALCWKFHSYKIEGPYTETSEGYAASINRESIIGIPIILGVTLIPNNNVSTIVGTNIILEADWLASVPPVLDSYISYRTDAILAANQGYLLKTEIGSLSSLTTEAKNNLVAAINEVWEDYNGSDIYNNILNSLLNAVLNK